MSNLSPEMIKSSMQAMRSMDPQVLVSLFKQQMPNMSEDQIVKVGLAAAEALPPKGGVVTVAFWSWYLGCCPCGVRHAHDKRPFHDRFQAHKGRPQVFSELFPKWGACRISTVLWRVLRYPITVAATALLASCTAAA